MRHGSTHAGSTKWPAIQASSSCVDAAVRLTPRAYSGNGRIAHLLYAGITSGRHTGRSSNPDEPASIKIEPAPGAHDVDPVAPVSVSAQTGTLTDVAMVNDAGKPVDGVLTPDAKVWHPVVPLGYGRTYTLTITSRGPGGTPSTRPVSFSTLTPPNQTKVSFQTTSEAPLQDGATYGVGIVIAAHFDEPITDKAEAERRLTVTGSPPVSGS